VGNISLLIERSSLRQLILARLLMLIGDGVTTVALTFAVIQGRGSTGSLGLVLGTRSACVAVFLVIGGAVADRWPRRRIMAISSAGAAAAQGVLATLLATGAATAPCILLAFSALGICTAFFLPASTGVLVTIVPPGDIRAANAVLSLAATAGTIAGPALGGALIATVGPGPAIAADAAALAVASAVFASMRTHEPPRTAEAGLLTNLRAGWSTVARLGWMRSTLLYFSFYNAVVMSALYVLGPAISLTRYAGAATWGVLLSLLGVGGLLGGVMALRLSAHRLLLTAYVGFISMAAPLVLLALGAPVPLLAASFLVAGSGVAMGNTLWETTLQRRIPEDALSRVSSWDWLVSIALRPLGLAAVGPVASALTPSMLLLGAAALLAVASAAAIASRQIRAVVV
jgi:MFS family permease